MIILFKIFIIILLTCFLKLLYGNLVFKSSKEVYSFAKNTLKLFINEEG